jgi:hypothetical protein
MNLRLHDQLGGIHVTRGIDINGFQTRHVFQDIGGHQSRHFTVFIFNGGQHPVGRNLATLPCIRSVDPLSAHLPAFIHIGIHFLKEFFRLDHHFIRNVEGKGLVINDRFQYHSNRSSMLLLVHAIVTGLKV